MKAHETYEPATSRVPAGKAILVADDFSASADSALLAAIRLSQDTGADLIVLNVQEEGSRAGKPLSKRDDAARQQLHEKTRLRICESMAKHLLTHEGDSLPPLTILVQDGDPATEIVLTAFDYEAELIVIADHGDEPDSTRRLGPTADAVVRYAPCAVMIVRPSRSELTLPPVHRPTARVESSKTHRKRPSKS